MSGATKGDAVARLIEDDILSGRIKPGAKLLQQELAERHGVSTTPVREALRKLEATGLVQHDANRGHVVVTTSADELDDILQVREHVEGLEAELACARLTDEDVGRLRELHGAMMAAGKGPANARLGTEFHDIISQATGSRTLLEISKKLRDPVTTLAYVTGADENAGLDEEHTAIVAAAERRDPAALREAVRAHVRSIRRSAVAYLRAQEQFAADAD